MKKLILVLIFLVPLTSGAQVSGHLVDLANPMGKSQQDTIANYAGVAPPATPNEAPCPTCPSKGAWNGGMTESWPLPQFDSNGNNVGNNQ